MAVSGDTVVVGAIGEASNATGINGDQSETAHTPPEQLTFSSAWGPSRTLGNISTRLRVETGDNVLMGGFIITGAEPKTVLVRAIGPSLPRRLAR